MLFPNKVTFHGTQEVRYMNFKGIQPKTPDFKSP